MNKPSSFVTNASSVTLAALYQQQQKYQNIPKLNSDSDSVPPYPTWLVVFLWLLTCVFCVETTLGNLLVLCAYKLERNIRKHLSNKFIVSLAVSDLIIGMEGFPLLTVYVVERERWPLGRVMCQMWLCVDYTLCLVSILTVLLITVDRYCSVCYPASYRVWQTRGKIHIMIVLSWVVPFGLFALMIFGWDFMTDEPYDQKQNSTAVGDEWNKCSAPFLNDPYVNMSLYIAYYWTTLAAMSVLYRGIHKAAKTLEMKSKAREKQTLALMLGQRCMAQVGVGILMQTDKDNERASHDHRLSTDLGEEEESLFHQHHHAIESETIEEGEEQKPSVAPSADNSTSVLCFDHPVKKLSANRTFSSRLLNSSRYLFKTPPPTKRQIKSYCSLDLCDSGSLCSSVGVKSRSSANDKRRTGSFRKALTITYDGHRVTRPILTADSVENNYSYNYYNKNYGACASPNRRESPTKTLSVHRDDENVESVRRLSSSTTTPEAMNRYLLDLGNHKRRLSETFDKIDDSCQNVNNIANVFETRSNGTDMNRVGNDHNRLYKHSLHSVLHHDDEFRTRKSLIESENDKENIENDEEDDEDEDEEDEESAASVDDLETANDAGIAEPRRSSKGGAGVAGLLGDTHQTATGAKVEKQRNWLQTLFTHPTWLLTKKRRVSKAEKRARKAFRTITVIVGTFALFWSPYFIVATVFGFCPKCVPTPLFFTSYYLCYLNSSVNPFAYAFANRLFRKTFVRILRGDFRRK